MLEELALGMLVRDFKEKGGDQDFKDEWILDFRVGQCPHKESTLD